MKSNDTDTGQSSQRYKAASVTYLGPLSSANSPTGLERGHGVRHPWTAVFSRLPMSFLIVVILPTVLVAIYYFLIAAPLFVSEARFVVRTQQQDSPSSIGIALQRVGLATSSSDAFAVHEYVRSRDGLAAVQKREDLRVILGRSRDPLSRYPRPWEGRSNEDLYKAFNRFVTIGYDSTKGISTLRVKAFTAEDAQRTANILLDGGEELVNELNSRSSSNTIEESRRTLVDAQLRLKQAQRALSDFRNSQGFVDPARSATESSQVIGSLMASLSAMRAERAQISSEAPNSPQLPSLDSRIRAYEGQIQEQRDRIAGDADSLAPKIGAYEDLVLTREIADKGVVQAQSSLDDAQLRARRQSLYLDRIVNPARPDKAILPDRALQVFLAFLTALLVYGIGSLVWAGIKEHRQE